MTLHTRGSERDASDVADTQPPAPVLTGLTVCKRKPDPAEEIAGQCGKSYEIVTQSAGAWGGGAREQR